MHCKIKKKQNIFDFMVVFTFDCYTQRKINSRRYAYETGNYVKMKQHLDEKEWSIDMINKMSQKPVEGMWKIFKTELLELRKKSILKAGKIKGLYPSKRMFKTR